MPRRQPLRYKIASEPQEFESIHALNYRTFVEEIPQHQANAGRRRVDRFHAENTYVICLAGKALVGMVALRGARPFSLDAKIADLDAYLPSGRKVCEVRLLAVEKAYRKTSVFARLLLTLLQAARAERYEVAVISGTVRELKLYRHLGFEPFGPRVGAPGAEFQPMLLTQERFEERFGRFLAIEQDSQETQMYLPGPVRTSRAVNERFAAAPVSHRSNAFRRILATVRSRLTTLTNAAHVTLLLGSGTLANDVVGAQLSARGTRGLVLSNGEFGDRLVDHAARWGLDFDVYRSPWGTKFQLPEIAARLSHRVRWLWFVHCETSTGMLNDLHAIKALCAPHGADVCVDAISSLGTVGCDLEGIAFATGVSGKGLAAYPGIALVFHRERPAPSARLPRYVDLGLYCKQDGIPFTQSSNLLAALAAALEAITPERFARLRQDAIFLRRGLLAGGIDCVVESASASPAVITIALPRHLPSSALARALAKRGIEVAYASRYLADRNWIQIALMGEYSRRGLMQLVGELKAASAGSSVRALPALQKVHLAHG